MTQTGLKPDVTQIQIYIVFHQISPFDDIKLNPFTPDIRSTCHAV
jgi:hypothetical protein